MPSLNARRSCQPFSRLLFALVAIATVSLAACGAPAEEPAEPVAAPEPAPQVVTLDRAVLADPSRPEAERDQDADRHPLEVYEFFGVQPGQTVADVYNFDGYNTHLLSRVVGDGGQVYSVFEFYGEKELFDGALYKVDAVTQRVDDAGLYNVELALRLSEVPSDSVDVAVAVRNYHEPGGIVGIVEVATPSEGWDNAAHRLNKQVVIDDFTAGGFELVEESDMLANPADDHTVDGFADGRHKTDRYALKFRKPGN